MRTWSWGPGTPDQPGSRLEGSSPCSCRRPGHEGSGTGGPLGRSLLRLDGDRQGQKVPAALQASEGLDPQT